MSLSKDRVSVPGEVIMYSFYASLEIRPTEIILTEGVDFGLFSFRKYFQKTLFK